MASVWGELKRRNVIRVAVAYAVVGWLLVEVSSVLLPAFEAPDWMLRVVILLIGIGFVLTVVISWFYDLTSQGLERTDSDFDSETAIGVPGRKLDFAIIGALTLAVVFMFVDNYLPESGPFAGAEIDPTSLEALTTATGVVRTAPDADQEEGRAALTNSVAVLLCDNLSPNPDDSYFAASIHEEILNQLVKIRALNVIARTSVMQYADAPPPISQIAEELNVEAVMECSVRYAGDAILVTAQLIDPETNIHLWSYTYPGDMSDLSTVFAMQADIAMNIANAVGAEFSLAERESIESIPTDSPEAYTLYLQAGVGSAAVAQSLLDRAIALDSEFALAYALRARIHTQNLLGISGTNPAQAAEFERLVREDAERALALDPALAQAHAALAAIHYANWRGAEAEAAFERAYQLRPDPDLALEYGRFKRYRGEYEDAVRLQRRGYELDPKNGFLRYQLGLSYSIGGYYSEADAIFRQSAEEDPVDPAYRLQIGRLAARLGNYSEALGELRLAETLWEGIELNAFRVGQLSAAYAQAGSAQDVLRMLSALQNLAREQPVGDAVWARVYLAVGDNEQALQHLTAAVAERSSTDLPTLSELATNPWGNPTLDQPEFRALLDHLWDE